jgi:hypothetical protein
LFKLPGVPRYVPVLVCSTAKHGVSPPASPRPLGRAPDLGHEDKPKRVKRCFVPAAGRTSDLLIPQHETVRQYLAAERAILAAEKDTEEDDSDKDTWSGVYVTLHVQALADRRKKRRESVPCKHNAEGSIRRQAST